MTIAKSPPKRPPVAQCDAIIRRYLKPDQNIDWAREMITFSALWKAYPSLAFWTHHELPFALNHMTWFQSVEGAATLESDWVVFHYEIPMPSEPTVGSRESALDITPQPVYTAPTPVIPRTVAEFLKSP